MVIEEGGEASTINLCKLCYKAKLVQQGKQATETMGMERGGGEKGASGKAMEGIWE